jgi:hypothetical protein
VYATADKAGEEDAAVFDGNPEIIFIVLHSNAHVLMKVRDKREGAFFGTVTSTPSPWSVIADLACANAVSICRLLFTVGKVPRHMFHSGHPAACTSAVMKLQHNLTAFSAAGRGRVVWCVRHWPA